MPGHVPRHPTRGHGGGRISLPTLGGSNNAKRAGSYNPMARSLSPLDPLSAIDEFEARRAVPSGGATGSSKLSPLKPGSAGSSSAAAAAAAVSALTAATNDAFDHEVIDVIEPPSPTRKAIAALPKPPAPREVPAAEVQSFLAVRVPLDHATHLQLLQAEFPSEKLARESADYASRIRTRKEEEELLRLERDRERRKAFLQHQRQQSERLEAEAEASLLARLSRQSTHERRITRQLQAVRNEKAVMTRNRAFREQQYAEQRERDYADALLREAEAADRHRSDYDAQTALLHMQYSSLVDQRNRERADRHAAMCRSIMDDLLYLSFKVVDYMKINDGMLPDSLLREWKVLFVHAKPVGLKYLTDPTKDAIPVDVEPMQLAQIVDVDPDRLSAASVSNGGAPDERTIALLDEAEFGQYLEGREGWAYRRGNVEPNATLGNIVSHILTFALSLDPPPPRDPLPVLPLKLCLLGKPMAGKTASAFRLASIFRISVIIPAHLVDRAVQIAANASKMPGTHWDAKLVALGNKARAALVAGGQVDDETLVALVAYRVRQLASGSSTNVSPPSAMLSAGTAVAPSGMALAVGATVAGSGMVGVVNGSSMTLGAAAQGQGSLSSLLRSPASPAAGNSGSAPRPNSPTMTGGTAAMGVSPASSSSAPRTALTGTAGTPGTNMGFPSTPPIQTPTGWILVGFPRTRAQAELLDRELAGYEEIKPVAPGNIKRSTSPTGAAPSGGGAAGGGGGLVVGGGIAGPKLGNSNMNILATRMAEANAAKRRSMLAPELGTGEGTGPMPLCCLDAVLVMKMDNEVAFKRSAGRRVDPMSGSEYHIEYAPPPMSIMERIEPADPTGEAQLHLKIKAFEDEEPKILEWYTRFNNLNILDANTAPDVTWTGIDRIVSDLRAKKIKLDEAMLAQQEKTVRPTSAATPAAATTAAATVQSSLAAGSQPNVLQMAVPMSPSAGASGQDAKDGALASAAAATAAAATATALAAVAPIKPSEEKKGPASGSRTPSAKSRTSSAKTRNTVDAAKAAALEALAQPEKKRAGPSTRLLFVLADEWAVIETTFTNAMKYLFRALRRERETLMFYFHDVKRHFERFVTRPDCKQDVLRAFQDDFNGLSDDMRGDMDVKAELHHRAEDMRDKLWAISDERKEQAETERTAIITSRYVEEHYMMILDVYIAMMQCEVDRFLATRQLLFDYARDMQRILIDEAPVRSFTVPKPAITTSGGAAGAGKDDNLLGFSPSMFNIKRDVQSASSTKSGGVGSSGGSGSGGAGKPLTAEGAAAANKSRRQTSAQGPEGVNPKLSVLPAATGAAGSSVGLPRVASFVAGAGGAAGTGQDCAPAEDLALLFPDLVRAHDAILAFVHTMKDDEEKRSLAHRDAVAKQQLLFQQQQQQQQLLQQQTNSGGSTMVQPTARGGGGAGGGGGAAAAPAKGGATAAGAVPLIPISVLEEKTDVELQAEHLAALQAEEAVLRTRLARILDLGCEHLRELRVRALEVFTYLDDCVGSAYRGEMNAIKEVVMVIKQAIELELKLANQLLLDGQRFGVDYAALTVAPDPSSRITAVHQGSE